MKRPEIIGARKAGEEHQVTTVSGGPFSYRRSPCEECPWRVDRTGSFPAEAFLHSARTACDLAGTTFACHMAGTDKPQVCAGFLLRGAANNMAVRMAAIRGSVDLDEVHDGGLKLHPNYRQMAIWNGCDEDDPALERCR